MENVIFHSPFILGGFLFSLVLLIFELRGYGTGYIMPVFSAFMFIAMSVYAILSGAALQEIAILLLLFIIISLTVYKQDGEGK